MALIIGNPTNIYLASANGIDFVQYLSVMVLPTILAGIVAFVALFLFFRKQLSKPIEGEAEQVVIKDKLLLWIGIAHLGFCTILLAIGSYINLEMWLVSLGAVVSLFVGTIVISIVRKQKPIELIKCLGRAPYELIPFVLSMFIMIVVLKDKGITEIIGNLLLVLFT